MLHFSDIKDKYIYICAYILQHATVIVHKECSTSEKGTANWNQVARGIGFDSDFLCRWGTRSDKKNSYCDQ